MSHNNIAKRYVDLWRNKWLTAHAESIDDMILSLREAANTLEEMKADGVTLDNESGGTEDDYALLVTTDPVVAEKHVFEDERKMFGDSEEDEDDLDSDDDEEENEENSGEALDKSCN